MAWPAVAVAVNANLLLTEHHFLNAALTPGWVVWWMPELLAGPDVLAHSSATGPRVPSFLVLQLSCVWRTGCTFQCCCLCWILGWLLPPYKQHLYRQWFMDSMVYVCVYECFPAHTLRCRKCNLSMYLCVCVHLYENCVCWAYGLSGADSHHLLYSVVGRLYLRWLTGFLVVWKALAFIAMTKRRGLC